MPTINIFSRFAKALIVAASALLFAPMGCDQGPGNSGGDQPDPTLGVLRAALVSDIGDDVAAIRIEVFEGAELVDSKTVRVPSDAARVREDNWRGDAFFVVRPGTYRVVATPLTEDGDRSEVCARATQNDVVVRATETTEIELLMVCGDEGTGALDVIVGLTHPPVIRDLSIRPSKLGWTCKRITLIADAVDPDGDELTYEWTVDNGAGAVYWLNGNGPVAQFGAETPMTYQLVLRVTDPMGNTAKLAFPLHIRPGPVSSCSNDRDNDGWVDIVDNCPTVPNPGQEDSDGDGIGDACENSADLVLTRAIMMPQPGVVGENMTLQVTVQNRGTVATAATELTACATEDEDFCVTTAAVPALGSMETAIVNAQLSADQTLTHENDQPYNFVATVDSTNLVVESHEDNNLATTAPFFVVVPYLPPVYVEQDHDDIIELDGATVVSGERIAYPNGAPRDMIPIADNEKDDDAVGPPATSTPDPVIDPLLLNQVSDLAPEDRIRALIQLTDEFPMRRLPQLNTGDRYSARNAPLFARRQAAFEGLRRARLTSAVRLLIEGLGGDFGSDNIATHAEQISVQMPLGLQIIEGFTLSGALLVEMPVSALDQLADHPHILHVDSLDREGYFTDDGITTNDVIDARALINTDPYFNAGAEGGGFFFGVIDSGSRDTHTNFNSPDQISLWRDCTNTTSATCADTGDTDYDPDDCNNHGTKVMGVVNANANLGANWRGVADTTADSWNIASNCVGNVSCTAAQRAFDAAAFWYDKVVTGSFSGCGDESSATSVAADAGYDAGMLMFFANGNGGPGDSTVGGPANAHKVMGVGAYLVTTGAQYGSQSEGPTTDNRIKPDLQAPTSSETSSSASDNAQGTLCCTSGATPYASSAGLLLTDWFGNFDTSPGKIYAMMLNYGENRYGQIDNTEGVGPFRFGTGGVHYSGSRTLNATGENAYVDFTVPAGTDDLRAAIWWPETAAQAHNDIDLRFEHPDGTSVAYSVSVNSVFEHVIVANPDSGDWRIRIRAYGLPTGPQTVYYGIRRGP